MRDSDVCAFFSTSYRQARDKFLQECDARSLSVASFHNPHVKGSEGEDLFTDVASIGPADAKRSLLLMSGTHGVEGHCGSGVQTGLLRSGHFERLPQDLRIVVVHAINPYGFSHDRRVTEDNVDLNRNFLNFDTPARPASDYESLHPYLVPKEWDGSGRDYADSKLRDYIDRHGMAEFQAAVSSGQYFHPDGIFYGGAKPTWSNTTFRSILKQHLGDIKELGVIDFHTGLGPYGYGELIAIGTEEEKARAVKWYGTQVTDPEAGTSSSAKLDGMVQSGIAMTLEDCDLTFVTLEFGTLPVDDVLTALRGDNWLHQRGNLQSPLKAGIKREIRRAFYPEADDWKIAVWKRAREVIDQAAGAISLG